MKKFLLGTVALIALGATVPALAADMAARPYTKAAPAAYAPIYNWTGFYIGGHIGGAFGGSNGFAGTTGTSNDGRFLGGLQGGADYQFAPNWVIGIEGQYSWLGSNNNNNVAFTGTTYVYNHNQRGLGSVTGRLGYTWGPALLYVKGGYAYSDYTESLTLAGVPAAYALNSSHHDGYTVGAGLQAAEDAAVIAAVGGAGEAVVAVERGADVAADVETGPVVDRRVRRGRCLGVGTSCHIGRKCWHGRAEGDQGHSTEEEVLH